MKDPTYPTYDTKKMKRKKFLCCRLNVQRVIDQDFHTIIIEIVTQNPQCHHLLHRLLLHHLLLLRLLHPHHPPHHQEVLTPRHPRLLHPHHPHHQEVLTPLHLRLLHPRLLLKILNTLHQALILMIVIAIL